MTDTPRYRTLDANEAVAEVAYRLSEVIAIYPVTPASVMGEHADSWSADRRGNLWGTVPEVVEMQSEGGAAQSARAEITVRRLPRTAHRRGQPQAGGAAPARRLSPEAAETRPGPGAPSPGVVSAAHSPQKNPLEEDLFF